MELNEMTLEYMKSSFSINTSIGCSLGCAYCIVEEATGKNSLEHLRSPEDLVSRLLNHRLFIPNKTLLAINNKTDPLLKHVRGETMQVITLLKKFHLANPIMIISRLGLKEDELSNLESYPGQVYFFTTYGGMTKEIEPHSGNQRLSFDTLRKRKNVKSIHYWRPLVRGLNDSRETLSSVLEHISGACDASVISGIRLTEGLARKIKNLGGNLNGWGGDTQHKHLPEEIVESILNLRDLKFPGYPIFKKTSCAISTLSEQPDYNLNYLQRKCVCPNQEKCQPRDQPSTEEIEDLRRKAKIETPWVYGKDGIIFQGCLTQGERSFLSFNLRYPVHSEKIKPSLFEESLK
jgi:DNA repair photolyase